MALDWISNLYCADAGIGPWDVQSQTARYRHERGAAMVRSLDWHSTTLQYRHCPIPRTRSRSGTGVFYWFPRREIFEYRQCVCVRSHL